MEAAQQLLQERQIALLYTHLDTFEEIAQQQLKIPKG